MIVRFWRWLFGVPRPATQARYYHRAECDGTVVEVGFQTLEEMDAWVVGGRCPAAITSTG